MIALITGITGQDGGYLAEFLLNKGYTVHGIKRRSSTISTERIDHIYDNPKFHLHYGDMTDSLSLINILKKVKPSEIYNLAAMSHVKVSFEIPEYVADTDGIGTLRLLEAIRLLDMEKTVKIYQASTSELFGKVQETPQTELTPFYPRSPYGVAKMYAYWISVNYRESYNIFASNGILFNHESPTRGETFVTRKITLGLSNILKGFQEELLLGNLNAKRDWGHAKDYVEVMWKILQYEKAEDWVIATGETHSIREFIIEALKTLDIEIIFKGSENSEIGYIKSVNEKSFLEKSGFKFNRNLLGREIIKIDPTYFRPTEVDLLIGDSTKARTKLDWTPKYTFKSLVKEMIMEDIK